MGMQGKRHVQSWVAALLIGALAGSLPAASPATVTDEQVAKAIQKGADYLLKIKKDNNWELSEKLPGGNHGGETALILYALVHVGASMDDPRLSPKSEELAPVAAWLAKQPINATYAAGLAMNALALQPPRDDFRQSMEKLRNFLLDSMSINGGYSYTWDGKVKNPKRGFDNSNTQYGVLGMWAAMEAGLEVPQAYWKTVDGHWRREQLDSGGWCYGAKPLGGHGFAAAADPKAKKEAPKEAPKKEGENPYIKASPTMTVAGLASLYVANEFLDTEIRGVPREDRNLASGLAWLDANFIPANNGYYMYGVERVGLATGRKFVGKHNWYMEGAKAFVNSQGPDGSFGGGGHGGGAVNAAYALLFLARGRNPVVFNKLEYSGPWNARPRDDANLTYWMSHKFEKPINWQTVNLKVTAEDWLDAPVLLITGSRDPQFKPEEVAKLRDFIEAGGTIFSTADAASPGFTAAMTKLAAEVVNKKYPWRALPKDHYLYTIQYPIQNPPPMQGVSNGVRELWIHSPVDMGAAWQRKAYTEKASWEIPANLYFYASGKGPLGSRLESLAVQDPATPTASTHNIAMARLQYEGNWDPEPGAWPRLAHVAKNQFKTKLTLTSVDIEKLSAKTTPIAHLTGTEAYSFKASEIEALKKFLSEGGKLLIDACGGSAEFVGSCETLLKALDDQGAMETLGTDHPLYNGSIPDSVKIETVDYRKFTTLKKGKNTKARLLVHSANGKPNIFFSADDITSGLLGTNTWGIVGYNAESSQKLARNLLLFASK